jgi:hypothetical protein
MKPKPKQNRKLNSNQSNIEEKKIKKTKYSIKEKDKKNDIFKQTKIL